MSTSRIRRAPLGAASAIALAAALLGACAQSVPEARPFEASRAASLELRRMTVQFATDRAEVDAAQARALQAFAAALPAGEPASILVIGHADDRASHAYNLDLAGRRAAAVAGLLRPATGPATPIDVRVMGEAAPRAAGHSAAARAVNRRVEVEAVFTTLAGRDCRYWPATGLSADVAGLPDLGCANTSNLAAMVADPRDLLEGRPLGPADGAREIGAVQRYRTDKVRPLPERSLAR
jgi:pilus biogenesis lipoprotein CpaD